MLDATPSTHGLAVTSRCSLRFSRATSPPSPCHERKILDSARSTKGCSKVQTPSLTQNTTSIIANTASAMPPCAAQSSTLFGASTSALFSSTETGGWYVSAGVLHPFSGASTAEGYVQIHRSRQRYPKAVSVLNIHSRTSFTSKPVSRAARPQAGGQGKAACSWWDACGEEADATEDTSCPFQAAP